ncbi:hypothetical protein [Carnobacterium pleistocenium]|uniref:hypothetical protein n=1 Tax=Carnobacterium pleistocenium TaxID=181073 RepID=UPI0005562150|nr:hypothetical protein [Carnobacterium pleistocenium]
MSKLAEQLERNVNRLDVEAIYKGAQREQEERAEYQEKIREKQVVAQEAESKAWNELLAKDGERARKEREAKIEMEIKEETEKAQAEIEIIRKKNRLSTVDEDADIREMVKEINERNR